MSEIDIKQLLDGETPFYPQTDIHGLVNNGEYAIDNVPTIDSSNLVTSGGVASELALGAVYDVTAHNGNAQFASLQALLTDPNINTLIPTNIRRGGMSIKFVSSNKYLQYRCTSDAFTTDVTKWQGVDDEPTADSDNLVRSGGVKSNLILKNGLIYTDNEYINNAILDIYWNTIPSDITGYSIRNFGYYQPSNLFYGQLYKGESARVMQQYDYNTFNGHFVLGELHIIVDKTKFYGSNSNQQHANLLSTCFVDKKIKPSKIADGAVSTSKIADGAVSTDKLEIDVSKIETKESKVSTATIDEGYFITIYGVKDGPYTAWANFMIEVEPEQEYLIKSWAGQSARLWIVKNQNQQVIAYSSDSSAIDYKSERVTIPSNGKYLYVNITGYNATHIPTINLIKKTISAESVYVNQSTNIKQYVDESVTPKGNIMWQKTLVCCGDSITEGADMDAEGIVQNSSITVFQSNQSGEFSQVTSNFKKTYGYQIAERNNMTFYNAGVSGSTMQGLSNKNGFSLENGRYTKLPENIDYLLIFFGYNDNVYGTLGTINDVTNESFYGGFNVVMPYLINKYPYAKIALIVPYVEYAYREAVRLLANKWGVACFDMYKGGTPLYFLKESNVGVEQSIVTSNRAKFQANGAHPNFKGHKQIGDMLEHFLRGI